MMLLDTCALLWLAGDQNRLSTETLRRIEGASIIYLSAISGFEIGLKHRDGKLALPLPPEAWLKGVSEHHGISVLDLDLDICVKASELPLIHRDPCDRFIIATALSKGLPVVTADKRFAKYGVAVLS
jgi:PIN domain nuclease of toxin-antitoxin system